MKKLIILLILFPLYLFPNIMNDSISFKKYNEDISKLRQEIKENKVEYERYNHINEITFSSISNQISAASYNLSIFSILFGVTAVLFGVYITYIERKIIKIRNDNETIFKQTTYLNKNVVGINDQIQKDIQGLFIKIKREETKYILSRLVSVPEDITNCLNQLLSRDLEPDDFESLVEAYLKVEVEPEDPLAMRIRLSFKDSYKLLFFQHFLYYAVKDARINNDLIEFYGDAMNCEFENDIMKSTNDFFDAINEVGVHKKSFEIENFLTSLNNSKFKNSVNIYDLIFNKIHSKDDKFKFYKILSGNPLFYKIRFQYGNNLKKHFESNDTLSHEEIEILNS